MKADPNDLFPGLILVLLGGFYVHAAVQYGLGTAMRMGGGFFPMLIGIAMVVAGISIAAQSFGRGAPLAIPDWRPLLAVAAGIIVFALTIRRFGLLPAVGLTTAVLTLGDEDTRPAAVLVLVPGVMLLIWLIFILALGLPIPLVRGWL